MKHQCALKDESRELTWTQKLKLISHKNQVGLSKFRSEVSIREEQRRHLRINEYAIHPFSTFRTWYEVYLVYLYLSVLITKPLDAGIMRIAVAGFAYRCYTVLTDVLCWIDIVLNFFTGYDTGNMIELRRWRIVRKYLFGPYFVFDLISAIPKTLLLHAPDDWPPTRFIVGVVNFSGMLKCVRIVSFVKYFNRSAKYVLLISQGIQFLICSMIIFGLVVHWMACLQIAVPKLVREYFSSTVSHKNYYCLLNDSEVINWKEENLVVQYTLCLFKSSAYILGIRIDLRKMTRSEEYGLAIFTYFVGKILIAFIWVVLAVAILNSRLMNIKFLELINQLEEYMKQKQLPLSLRERILEYFSFKYRHRFYEENLIRDMLSENLKNDANLHVCKSLIKNVDLFSDLSLIQIGKMVNYLTPEIYLPNDVITRAGSMGKAMYFISSGTVAVYTRSGGEVCHLQDGAYFGEVCLVLKSDIRLSTVVALESSQLYKLQKKDLERYLLSNKSVRHKILTLAEERLKYITQMEEEYKEQLFEQKFGNIHMEN